MSTEYSLPDYEKTYKSFRPADWSKEIDFFKNKKLNIAYNCIDRHAKSWRRNKIALYWEGEGCSEKYTFAEFKEMSDRFANVLKSNGIKKGDRVFIFLPRIPEQIICFFGTLKLGAVAGPLFPAFAPDALEKRLSVSDAKAIITDSDLKERVLKIKDNVKSLRNIIIIDSLSSKKSELSYPEEMGKASPKVNISEMDSDDDAYIIWASGTEGEVDAVVHRHGSVSQQHMTGRWVLDFREEDVYWCTADPGWITGTVYGMISNLSNGVSSLMFEGRFSADRWLGLIEKYGITVWYTAPTALRMIMKEGPQILKKYDLSSLRHICSVGEPLNPEVVRWCKKNLRLPVYDTWWQTETGSIVICNYPSVEIRPGSMGKPVPGMKAMIVDDSGKTLTAGTEGNLVLKPPWPSMMKYMIKQPKLYAGYFRKGLYWSNDRAYVDKDGYFWYKGRSDDVIKTAGERVGPFEVESALVGHPAVAEAGVIGKPDNMRGEIIKAFVVLNKGQKQSESLKEELKLHVKRHLAGHAYPREIDFVGSLPKTRSGKIMRKLLKNRETGLPEGDISAMEKT